MIDVLKQLQPNVAEETLIQKKILCIIEGDLEFRYISKIFNLFGYKKGCYPLSAELVKVAWGDRLPKNINIVNEKCEFQGGSLKGRKVPFPAIDAFELYSRDLAIFDSVIVFFDGDKDKNNEVEEYFKEEFKDLGIDNSLLVSMPCFESTLIDFCICGKCREGINNIADGRYPCDKYKKNFSKLECFKGIKHLIVNLDNEKLDALATINSKLNPINNIIQNYMAKL